MRVVLDAEKQLNDDIRHCHDGNAHITVINMLGLGKILPATEAK